MGAPKARAVGAGQLATRRALTDALATGGGEAKRPFELMMMNKIDIEAARRG